MARLDPDVLASLARQMAAENSLEAVLTRVVDASLTQIDGAEHAGITVLSRTAVSTPIASDELVQEIDKHQYATGEGPCLSAARDHEPVVRVPDLSTDDRWPEFAAAAVHLGVRSMLTFQLYTNADTIGALNLYATQPNAFTDESVHTGALLATHAAVAAAAATESGHMYIALQSGDVIGQAKGILMERFRITAEQAFDLLIAAAQNSHRKLNEVAAELAATGELSLD